MPGRVFISCGQRSKERGIAEKIKKLLKKEFGLDSYLAFKIQSFDDTMTITKELGSSDYFLFIDFFRKTRGFLRRLRGKQDLTCSLFTDQELALAHHLRFEKMIALQEKGAPLEGFLRYVLSNPEQFENEDDLLNKIRQLVCERGWVKEYSRNLVVIDKGFTGYLKYTDHTGGPYLENVYQVKVENRRYDSVAMGSICILESFQRENLREIVPFDRSNLKWAGEYMAYEKTIIPRDFGVIDLFAIRSDKEGVFLHSRRDTPRECLFAGNGSYKFVYKLFSHGFQPIRFSIELDLNWTRPDTNGKMNFETKAKLIGTEQAV